jgi:hypothetical protein
MARGRPKGRQTSPLVEIVAKAIKKRRRKSRLAPIEIANEVMQEIDPTGHSVDLVYEGCHLHCRAIARNLLARFDVSRAEKVALEQGELFDDTLQWRYPAARDPGEEPEYVLIDQLSDDDYKINIERLLQFSEATGKHAYQLFLHWRMTRLRQGRPLPPRPSNMFGDFPDDELPL